MGLLTHVQAGWDLDVCVGRLDNIFRIFLWKRITDIAMTFLNVRSDHILREKRPRDSKKPRITDIAMIFLNVRSDHILREKRPRDSKKPLEGTNFILCTYH